MVIEEDSNGGEPPFPDSNICQKDVKITKDRATSLTQRESTLTLYFIRIVPQASIYGSLQSDRLYFELTQESIIVLILK